jgi:hypothetical protein
LAIPQISSDRGNLSRRGDENRRLHAKRRVCNEFRGSGKSSGRHTDGHTAPVAREMGTACWSRPCPGPSRVPAGVTMATAGCAVGRCPDGRAKLGAAQGVRVSASRWTTGIGPLAARGSRRECTFRRRTWMRVHRDLICLL